jgi:hypothetical protein
MTPHPMPRRDRLHPRHHLVSNRLAHRGLGHIPTHGADRAQFTRLTGPSLLRRAAALPANALAVGAAELAIRRDSAAPSAARPLAVAVLREVSGDCLFCHADLMSRSLAARKVADADLGGAAIRAVALGAGASPRRVNMPPSATPMARFRSVRRESADARVLVMVSKRVWSIAFCSLECRHSGMSEQCRRILPRRCRAEDASPSEVASPPFPARCGRSFAARGTGT